jgi:hypothetical protein
VSCAFISRRIFTRHLGHLEGEPDIERDGDGQHDEVGDVESPGEHDAGQQQFQDQRSDGEQQEAQEELHPLHAALDDPAEPAGLARDVVAQAERVDMLERLQRQLPQRPLRHPREDRVAQLLEAHAHQPRHAIGHREPHRAHGASSQPGRPALARQRIDRGLVEKRRADVTSLATASNASASTTRRFTQGLSSGQR